MEILVSVANSETCGIGIHFFHSGEADIKIVDKIGNCRFNMVLKYFFDSFADVDENGEKKVQ